MKKYLAYASLMLVVLLARVMPFSWIVGSYASTFSWSTMIAPVVSGYAGFAWFALFLIPFKVSHVSHVTAMTIGMLLLHRAPLAAACFAYRYRQSWIWVGVPLACMALFIAHPTGSVAWPYAMYWLMPVSLWFVHDTFWVRALSSSMVAHAVGSVIWLYTGNIPAPVWYGLIPVVMIERLGMAFGIMLCDMLFVGYKNLCRASVRHAYKAGWL